MLDYFFKNMKIRKNVYLIIGIVLIILNLLVDIIQLSENSSRDTSYNIGYFIGSNSLLIIGMVLIRISYKLNKKLKRKEKNGLEEAIEEIGNTNG